MEKKLNTIILIVALLLQAGIPLGYMPSVNDAGQFSIEICSGLESKSIPINGDHSDETIDKDSSCPYFIAGGSILPGTIDYNIFSSSWLVLNHSLYEDPYISRIITAQYKRGPPYISLI